MNRFIGLSFFVVAICVAAPPVLAGNYTGPGLFAQLVIRDPDLGSGRYTGRYYFDRGGYRIDVDGPARFKSLVFNSFHRYFITVGSNRRLEIDDDKNGSLSLQFGDAPCAGFKSTVKVGSDTKSGRELQVWRCSKPKQALLDGGLSRDYKATVWYDAELKHFIRKEANNGVTIELKKVVPGRQPPALFDVPSEAGPASDSSRVADVETVE